MQNASAHQVAQFMRISLAATALTQGALTDLIREDRISPFENYVVQYLRTKRLLQRKSDSQIKDLLHKRQTPPDTIKNTLSFIFDLVDRHRANLISPMFKGQAQMTATSTGKQLVAERRKKEITRLTELTAVDFADKEVPDIIDALTQAFAQGWMTGGMPHYYMVHPKKTDPKALAKRVQALLPSYYNGSSSRGGGRGNQSYPRGGGRGRGGRGGRGRGGRGRGGTQTQTQNSTQASNTSNYNYSSNTTNRSRTKSTRPARLYTKSQMPNPVGGELHPKLGWIIKFTLLKAIASYCNNFQVWGGCAIHQQDPDQCKFKHKCSNCNDQTHGRRDCPQALQPGEDRNA